MTLATADAEQAGGVDSWSCTGNSAQGYGDIAEGADVTVYDASGKVVGSGSLGAGRFLENPQDAYSPCRFTFSLPGVLDGSKFYSVEVSHRGRVTVSADQAKAGAVAQMLGS